MNAKQDDVVVPIVHEELHADAIPVETGGVRVTKHIEGHDEILEQELRKGRVEVRRVKTDRVVDGPQPVQRSGNKLVIPIVSEVLHVEKRWVVTEEIHLTQIEERETVRQKVRVNHEEAEVERLDQAGNAVPAVDTNIDQSSDNARSRSDSLVARNDAPRAKRRILSGSQTSILKNRTDR